MGMLLNQWYEINGEKCNLNFFYTRYEGGNKMVIGEKFLTDGGGEKILTYTLPWIRRRMNVIFLKYFIFCDVSVIFITHIYYTLYF